MQPRALVLDCDGVLAETERDGHLVAFNQMFAEFDLPVRWSSAQYADLLRIGGGKERLATLLTPEFVDHARLPHEAAAQSEAIARWHRRKTEIYTELVQRGALSARSGVGRIIGEALSARWRVAVASTSAPASVRAVLDHVAGTENAERVAVFAGDVVAAKKPAPDIYELAVRQLAVAPESVIVVEDSQNGLVAARGAGLACVVTVSSYTAGEDFSGAALVLTALGDPGGESARVLSSESGIMLGNAHVTLADLAAVMSSQEAQ